MSTAVVTEAIYTPEDLLAMPDEKNYELVDGRLVERNMGAESSWVGGRLFLRLGRFCDDNDLGIVWPADNGYQCFSHAPRLVRRPDVSFIKKGRLPGDASPDGWITIAPDLVVEVVSPNDLIEEFEQKLDDYRKAGVALVWVIYPKRRKAKVIRRNGSATDLEEDDELSGEDVLPGFRFPLREILPRPESATSLPAGPNGVSPA